MKQTDTALKLNILLLELSVSLPTYLVLALPEYGKGSIILAWFMFQISFLSWLKWYGDNTVPILPVILSLYTVYFSLPVFYVKEITLLHSIFHIEETISRKALAVALLAQFTIWIGWSVGIKGSVRQRFRYVTSRNKLIILAYGIIAAQYGLFYLTLNNKDFDLSSYSQIINGLTNMYLSLGIFYYLSEEYGWNAIYVCGILLVIVYYIVVSVNNTMLSDMLLPLITLGLLMLRKYRLRSLIVAGALLVVFVGVQPVKGLYRQQMLAYETEGRKVSIMEKIQIYGKLLEYYWSGDRVSYWVEESAGLQTSKRLSLLPTIGLIVKNTPSNIPYQAGSTFEYLLYTPIPRFMYSEKPTAQEANIWFAQSYGLLNVELAKTTMVGISHVGEVFVNFGYVGIPIVFTVFGFLLARITRSAEQKDASLAKKCIYTALIPGFLAIESTLTGLIAATIYTLILSNLAMCLISIQRMPRKHP